MIKTYKKILKEFPKASLLLRISVILLSAILSILSFGYQRIIYKTFVKDHIEPEQLLTVLLCTLILLGLVLIGSYFLLSKHFKTCGKLEQLEKESKIHEELKSELKTS